MHRITHMVTLAALVLLSCLGAPMAASGVYAQAMGTPVPGSEVPSALRPPGDAVLLFAFVAGGDQIYACEATTEDPEVFAWTFKAPEAELRNARGEIVAAHFAGPTWQGSDGSTVVGAVLERAGAPDEDAIPWLLLEAKSHTGSGVFSTITYIQRLDTRGGVAPSTGCDAAHADAEARVPYEATYAFYYPAAS